MKQLLYPLTLLTCIFSACAPQIINLTPSLDSAPTYAPLPTRKSTELPTRSPTETPTAVPVAQSTPPAWVAEFADPILGKAFDQYPSFQDDFTAGLNRGWFYLIDGNTAKPYFAHLEEDALILRIPDGAERRDAMAYSPHLARTNFVLSVDFKFGKTEPNDLFEIHFQQSKDQYISVELSKNETTSIFWNLHNHWETSSGLYDHFGPALVTVVLIVSGDECALYINHDPLGYLSACRADPIKQPVHDALSFHLLSTTGNPAMITVDNVKIWDLDKNRERP